MNKHFCAHLASLCLALASSLTSAQHSAHVHGVAELMVAIEGNALELMLTSPAMGIVGFEHAAVTDEQLVAVQQARQQLLDPDALFAFVGTSCELSEGNVNLAALASASDKKTHHQHDEHHDHENEHHGGDETHSDVEAHYRYDCENGDKLEAITIGGERLPFGLESINAMWVSNRGQGSSVLKTGAQVLRLNQ